LRESAEEGQKASKNLMGMWSIRSAARNGRIVDGYSADSNL
jgi:hypothetical protein